jgi:hypothetical protein
MHCFLRILTEGETKQEVYDHALDFAGALVERGEFDSYDAEHAKTSRLASALGKKAVERTLAANRREFDLAIYAARLMLQECTDEHIYQRRLSP